ncbi:Alpha/beta hydrolase family-domain-containing protein [Aspergillus novoparasiticus]|uniref:Alpha/beta hydrolase family-domain-containing protein n=1 Tax=Aspergillus novoparasiticus TaxID=986946 RepID=A0A5N6F8Q3_9EURO|nr:Alpha/beta hydrolase family-domain-containing protein [Aspergillus novoparasiticus]
MSNNPTVVIVPGSWHCPKHYKYLIDGLAKFNYEAVGVTLPSVNSSPPHASWDQDAQAVREVIMKSLDNGNDVIAVAHSFGGVAMSEAVKGLGKEAREKRGLKGGVVRLIYMCAMALPEGQTHVGQIQPQTPEEEELERQRQELQAKYGGMRFTEDGAMLLDKDVIRDVFYNRCDPKDVDEAVELLGSFPTGPLTVPVTYTAYREIPSTYIVCENDKALALSYQERMIAQGDGIFHITMQYIREPTKWTSLVFKFYIIGADDAFHSTLAAPVFKLRCMPTIETALLLAACMEFPDLLAGTTRPARHHDEIVTSPVTHHSDTIQRPVLLNSRPSIGSSLNSPVYLLNSKLNATILEECLARIHDTIVTGCASRFIGYECNLYKPGHRYQLEEDGSDRPQGQKPVQLDPISTENLPKTPSSISQSDMSLITSGPSSQQPGSMAQDISHRMTILGTIRFLDHFSDLYGNRLTVSARKKSDAVLKAVLRAFSLQWLSSADSSIGVQSTTNYNSPIGRDTPRNSPMDAFYDSWFQARSLINNALSVQSFRVIYAILMFDGISIPAKASGETLVAHEFLDVGLQKLNCLAGLVEQYCINLGPHSTYGTIMEASLSVVRWCGHVRDIGAALTADHVCKLSDVSGNEKGQSTSSGYEPMSSCSFHQSFNQDFDDSVPGICRAAVAEAFRVWKQVVAIKGILSNQIKDDLELRPNLSEDITSTTTAVGRFKETFGSFLDYCIENLGFLSMRSRLSSVSIMMFWNLGIFVLIDTLKPTMTGTNQPCSHSIFSKLQTYNEEAALSVARTAECVLSLPFEKIFNLQNGVSAEASVLSYHITPTLVAVTFQKAIEAILDMQLYPPCGEGILNDRSLSLHADSTWKQHIDTIMKGLVSLDVTIGGSLASGVAIQNLMQIHGDIISDCWSCDFET